MAPYQRCRHFHLLYLPFNCLICHREVSKGWDSVIDQRPSASRSVQKEWEETMSAAEPLRLMDIAHGRSGDKGNHANIAVIAYTEAGFQWLRQHLTSEAVADYFRQ